MCLEHGRHAIVRAARQNAQAKRHQIVVAAAREAARQESVVANEDTVAHKEALAAAPPAVVAKIKKRTATRYVFACSSYRSKYCAINVLSNDLE